MLERGTPCYFKWQNRWHPSAKVIQTYPEHNGVLRVEKNGLDYVLLPDEVRSVDDHEDILERERMAEAGKKYSDLICAWKAGKKTNKELAEATNTPLAGIASRVRAVKRRGFLK